MQDEKHYTVSVAAEMAETAKLVQHHKDLHPGMVGCQYNRSAASVGW